MVFKSRSSSNSIPESLEYRSDGDLGILVRFGLNKLTMLLIYSLRTTTRVVGRENPFGRFRIVRAQRNATFAYEAQMV